MSALSATIEARPNGATNTIRPLTRPLAVDEKGAAAMVRATQPEKCLSHVCDRTATLRGMCTAHYKRWLRGVPRLQDPIGQQRARRDLSAHRVWARVVKEANGCWSWTGGHHRKGGYGIGRLPGTRTSMPAHRVVYILTHGPVPGDLPLDHFACDNPGCVNPDHVRPASTRENNLRSNGFASINAAKTHCPAGHPYSGRNLYVVKTGGRACRKCKADWARQARAARSPRKDPAA